MCLNTNHTLMMCPGQLVNMDQFSVLVIRSPTAFFHSSRGLRLEDPLSP